MFNSFSPYPPLSLLQRELLVFSREKRLFGLLAIMTGILVVATAILLLRLDTTSVGLASFARNLFRTQFYLLYTVALIVIPVAAATTMVSERRQDAFSLLYTTLIPPFWIVWSKALALVGIFGIMFVGLLPFTGVVYFFAGMETQALFQYSIFLFSLALGTSSIGLLSSSLALTHGRALCLTCLGVLIMVGFPAVLRGVVYVFSPGAAVWIEFMGIGSTFDRASSGAAGWIQSLVFAAYQFGVALLALRMAQARALTGNAARKRRVRKPPPGMVTYDPPRHTQTFDDGQNPIAAKDRFVNPLGRGKRPRALGIVGFLAGALISVPNYVLGTGSFFDFSSMDSSILSFVLPPMVALHFIAERESDTWDNLRVTPVTGRELANGKLWGVWLVIRPLILGLLAGKACLYVLAFVASLPGGDYPDPLWLVLGMFALLVNTGTGMVFSLYGAAHRTTTVGAVVMAYVASIGLPMLASIPIGLLMIPIVISLNWAPTGAGTPGFWEMLLMSVMNLYYVLIAYYVYRRTAAVLERKLGAESG